MTGDFLWKVLENLMLVLTLAFGAVGYVWLWLKADDLLSKLKVDKIDTIRTIVNMLFICITVSIIVTVVQQWL